MYIRLYKEVHQARNPNMEFNLVHMKIGSRKDTVLRF